MPTIQWKINEDDIMNHRSQKFGTSPVKNAYWKCNNQMPDKSPYPVIFKKYPGVRVVEKELNILTKSLLGFSKDLECKQKNSNVIINEKWLINLRTAEKEYNMMDSFLRGFNGQSEELRNAWEGEKSVSVDVSEELKELLKVYEEAEEHLKANEERALEILTMHMERYMKCHNERKEITYKLHSLKGKLMAAHKRESCEDEGEDDDSSS